MFGFGRKKNEKLQVDEKRIHRIVDFTCISPVLTKKELERAMCVAYKNKYYSIVVNPINVSQARAYIDYKLKSVIKLVSVIGFPLGETPTEVKLFEIKKAINDGADELDVMIPVSRIRMGDYAYIKSEISRVMKASKRRVVKIIAETANLNRTELNKLCAICAKLKVNYIQTSTGFASGGASIEDVELMLSASGRKCEVKASGGIENRNQAIILLRAGATRIGTSREI